jgi:hypothetical protein
MRSSAAASLIACLLVLALLIAPAAAAEKLEFEDATIINVEAPEDLCISSIQINDIAPNGDLQLNLNAYGEMYLLTVKNKENWGWWEFWINCTYPNGTVQSEYLKTWKTPYITTDYDVVIQPYFLKADWHFDVDVHIGIVPFRASFRRGAGDFQHYAPVAFSQVSGTTTNPTFVVVYLTTQEEYAQQQENDLGAKIGQGVSEFFSWTWDQILLWTAKIPGIGPLFSDSIEIAALTVSEVFFWVKLIFFEYWYIVILLLEFWFIGDAMMHSRTLFALCKRLVRNHVSFVEGCIKIIEISVDLVRGLISTISAVVNALKPI